MAGATVNSFNTISSNGENSNILHNVHAHHTFENGKTALFDAGCIYKYYCSDMTRTFPIGNKFNTK